jgi:ribonuclease P protein component
MEPAAGGIQQCLDVTDRTFGWNKKLRKTDEFSSVFHFRCRHRGQLLEVSAGPNDLGIARLGLIVPKRVLPGAVGRNRLRRLIREWFRQNQDIAKGLDIIARLMRTSGTDTLDETVLRKDFLSGLSACRGCVATRQPTLIDND